MYLRSLLTVFIVAMLLVSCKNDKNKFLIIADITNMPEQTILLEEMGINETKILDSVRSDKNGHFEFSGISVEPGLYRLHFSENQFLLLSIFKEKVKIAANWNQLDAYKVNGSASSESLRLFFENLKKHIIDINTLAIIRDSMQMRGNDSLFKEATKEMDDYNTKLTLYIENYVDSTQYLPNAILAAQILNQQTERPFLESFITAIPKRFPNQKLGKDFITKFNKGLGENNGVADEGLVEGAMAPEISLENQLGEKITLSSLKGRYVLIDFWASWCTPCRKENPNVVSAFKMFKDKNFTILGVSLDNDKEKWLKAINEDHLDWAHVSDLKGWESVAARDYNISSIPSNFLIDPKGVIIARDLKGPDLENKLQDVLQ